MANGIIHTTNFDHYSWALCSTVRDSWCSSCLHRPFAVAPPLLGNIVDSSGRHRHLSILDFEHLEPKVNKIWLVKLFLSYRILIFERSHFNSLINPIFIFLQWQNDYQSNKKLKLDSVASSQFLLILFFFFFFLFYVIFCKIIYWLLTLCDAMQLMGRSDNNEMAHSAHNNWRGWGCYGRSDKKTPKKPERVIGMDINWRVKS